MSRFPSPSLSGCFPATLASAGTGRCRCVSGTSCGFCKPGPAGMCPHGDPYCPCQDNDECHYEGKHPMQCPTTLIVGCLSCR
jgi:hypothetical protein